MSTLVFVDTNVFLYSVDNAEPAKQGMARAWRDWLWASGRGRTSFQVLQEFYYQAFRKDEDARASIRAEIRNLMTWSPEQIDEPVLHSSWQIQDRYRISFWDALIVAAARTASCRYLLSEDFQPGQDFDGVQVVNPFQRDFDSLDS